MVDGLISAKKMIGKSNIIVYPGDNVSSVNYAKAVKQFKNGATAFLTKVKNPSKYGCPIYSDDGKLVQIREKPEKPQSNWVVTAPYLFDNKVFEFAKRLKPSKRGELEITDLLNLYLNEGSLKLNKNSGEWFDCGSFEDLLLAGEYVRRNQKKFFP
jgi:glucose-1-phosphate thymidylyltransferase